MIPREIEIQEKVTSWLEKNGIYASTVTFTYESNNGLLSITVYTKDDYEDLLKLTGYKDSCDKSGYTLYDRTLFLTGLALTGILL